MSGWEHYAEAERHLAYADNAEIGKESSYHLQVASVHATLALVAATTDGYGTSCSNDRYADWREATK